MSCNVDELFWFTEIEGGYAVEKKLKTNLPTVTELEIPEEYKGKPIIMLGGVGGSNYLKSVKLPKSLKRINDFAVASCPELEHVEFNSAPYIGLLAFGDCPKLPPETIAMGLVHSTDLTQPILEDDVTLITYPFSPLDIYRADVYELLAKNNCFREIDPKDILYRAILNNKPEIIPIAEQYGMLDDANLIDGLIHYAIEQKIVEITAYLLDLKNRKFGFDHESELKL